MRIYCETATSHLIPLLRVLEMLSSKQSHNVIITEPRCVLGVSVTF